MKNFLNVSTLVMGVIFILGLVTTAIAGNWVAFIWVVIGFLWMGMSRGHEVQKEALREDYEDRLTELRRTRDDYIKLYKDLIEDNLRLTNENQELRGKGSTLGAAMTTLVEEQRGTHGNIKIKRKKKAAPEVKTDIQDKS